MKKQIIGITSMRSVGCTFLDWSILFLNGNEQFFSNRTRQLEPLTHNPISVINAHGHKKNHPIGFEMSQHYMDAFLQSPHNLLTLYPVPVALDVALEKLRIKENQVQDPNVNQVIDKYRLDDYAKFLEYLLDSGGDLIYLDHSIPLYDIEWRNLDRTIISPNPVDTTDDFEAAFQNVYFKKSLQTWKDMNLTDVWDIRERLALDKRPLGPVPKPNINFSRRHCLVNSQEWFSNGTRVVKHVMDFCNLQIDKSRWDQWVAVYNQWQTLHKQRLDFCYQLPHIIDAIINNWYYEIDLTFNQEVVVQHCLIYQHNLNLKTWQLSKFPNNTQALHKLLETNIHPIKDV